jgi:isocitrate dehydrogenase kinase/phosphatase
MIGNGRTDPGFTAILAAFDAYQGRFHAITRRAAARFVRREWSLGQRDAAERLALYKEHVDAAVRAVNERLGPDACDPAVWTNMMRAYETAIGWRDDGALAATFFNSVSRRVFTTVGVDARVEFTEAGAERAETEGFEEGAPALFATYFYDGDARGLIERILADFAWSVPFRDANGDAAAVATAIEARTRDLWGSEGWDAAELLRTVFYRNKGAYIVGRLRHGGQVIPLVLALLHLDEGIVVDAVLLTADEASIVFGFSWSYFHVEVTRPEAMVDFLRTIMPVKRRDELFTSLGYNKHGKTVLYRTLMRHLDDSGERFEEAEGEEGLVMMVFTLRQLNVVFKIIKDAFPFPKRTSRQQVMDKYHLVFVRDRVGRLADAQEFEHLEFRRGAFQEPLLAKLRAVASRSVAVEQDRVVVRHLYTERRVTPLNLYLRQADAEAARDAVLDYGNAIKDLAAANIFAGDMLLKNFGVSRHGRVICYDYDELVLLTDCTFRALPHSDDPLDEMSAEPWFSVGESDVFPEEFEAFLVPPGDLRDVFLGAHADLLSLAYWRTMQQRVASGELFDVFPYRQGRRLKAGSTGQLFAP